LFRPARRQLRLDAGQRWAVRFLLGLMVPTTVLVSVAAVQAPLPDLREVGALLIAIGVVGLMFVCAIAVSMFSGGGRSEPGVFEPPHRPVRWAARVPGVIATAALILAGVHVLTGFGPLSDLIGQQSWAAGLDVTPWRFLIALLVVQCAASLVEGLVDEHERSAKR
jgi:hypothetical protein